MTIKRLAKKSLHLIARTFGHRPVVAQVVKLAPSEMLAGRTALITGGTSGIGYATADAFLSAGADVVLTSRTARRAEEACARLAASDTTRQSRVHGVAMDLSDTEHLQSAFDRIVGMLHGKPIDILVNNAGILGGGIFDAPSEEFRAVLNTNLQGTAFMSRIVAKYMIANRIRGNILNIASSSSLRPAISAYTLSKWGIRGLTLGLAKSLIPHGIVVNGIAPGPTATPMLKTDAGKDIGHDTLPNGRYALPEEIASMAVFLVSGMGRTIVGDIVYMTGGAGLITFEDTNYCV